MYSDKRQASFRRGGGVTDGEAGVLAGAWRSWKRREGCERDGKALPPSATRCSAATLALSLSCTSVTSFERVAGETMAAAAARSWFCWWATWPPSTSHSPVSIPNDPVLALDASARRPPLNGDEPGRDDGANPMRALKGADVACGVRARSMARSAAALAAAMATATTSSASASAGLPVPPAPIGIGPGIDSMLTTAVAAAVAVPAAMPERTHTPEVAGRERDLPGGICAPAEGAPAVPCTADTGGGRMVTNAVATISGPTASPRGDAGGANSDGGCARGGGIV